MIVIKTFRIAIFTHDFFVNFIKKSDIFFHKLIHDLKHWISKIKFKNLHKLIVFIVSFSKREIIYFKRKFDSKQPSFFLKPQKLNSTKSFFLKNVSEYKETLRKKDL